jgi:hypothetical protein
MGVDIGSELLEINRGGAFEGSNDNVPGNELPPPDRAQFANRDAVAGDDEVLTAIQRPHDLSTLVAKLALGQLPGHSIQRSTRATRAGGPVMLAALQ